ncbi:MAG: putative zinc-binding protein [Syntrophomonadaceae bacterium]
MLQKVMILPCSGIGKPTGEIGRQAAYRAVRQLRPDKTGITCLARLVIDDPETIDLIRANYVITLDGCPDDCARKNVERFGKMVDCPIHVADLLEQHPDLHPLGILNLGEDGLKLVELMADHVAARVDEFTGEEG